MKAASQRQKNINGDKNKKSDRKPSGSFSLSRISLNWPLNAQRHEKTFFQRAAFHQALLDKSPRIVNDDVWTFNSQVSTQWGE